MTECLYSYFIIKSIIFFSYFIIIVLFPESLKKDPFYLPNKKAILEYNKTKRKLLYKGRKFLSKCLNFPNIKRYKYVKNPKVSVIIPMFNCEKTIRQTLKSVQIQNLSKIEILLINDFSSDNTSKIIEKINRKDRRIKLINNLRSMGTLYSRCIGVLIAKGEYIFSLDNDDLYFTNDVFDTIFKIGKNYNLDIIEFLTIDSWNYKIVIKKMKDLYTYQYPDGLYIKQPELSNWMIKFNNNFLVHNNMIWDKCIKSSVYKKSVNLLTPNRYSKFLSWAEDTSMNFIIFNIAKTFQYIHKYGIFHHRNKFTASYKQSVNSKIFGEIFLLDVFFDFSKNDSITKNFIVGQALKIYKNYNINKFIGSNSFYLKYVLNKIIQCNFLQKQIKRKLKNLFCIIL